MGEETAEPTDPEADDDDGGRPLNIVGDSVQQQQEQAEQSQESEAEESGDPDKTVSEGDKTEPEAETEAESPSDSESTASAETNDDGTDESEELPPVKDRPRVLTYLPEEFKSTFEIQVSKIKLEWQEHGDGREIEKLRHIYPILMKVGVDNAEELDAEQIGELMDEVEEWDRQES